MADITLKGNPIHTIGRLPTVGTKAPGFELVSKTLESVTLAAFAGKTKVLNIFPSIDTDVCAKSVRRFNEEAAKLDNTVVINVSMDLPFAQKRFCGAEGIANCETLSAFRGTFAKDYGVQITDSGLKGLCSRAIVVIDENNTVVYTEQVPEIVQEPNYDKALAALNA